MPEPIPSQEGELNEEQKQTFERARNAIQSGVVEARAAAIDRGEEPRPPSLTPFQRVAVEMTEAHLLGYAHTLSPDRLNEYYQELKKTLPDDAPDDYKKARDIGLNWIKQEVTRRETSLAALPPEEREYSIGEISSLVYDGVARERPDSRIPLTGELHDDWEQRAASASEEADRRLAKIRQDFAEAKEKIKEQELKGDLSETDRSNKERNIQKANELAQEVINNPELAEYFASADAIWTWSMKQAETITRVIRAKEAAERQILSETKEETEALPDYREEKDRLIDELFNAKPQKDGSSLAAGSTDSWDKAGWSLKDGRTFVLDLLTKVSKLSEADAESIMAAALLHGKTAQEFVSGYQTAMKDTQKGLIGYLMQTNILRDDDDVVSIFYEKGEKKDVYDQMMLNRPGSFEGLAWQMAHAPGTNTVFQEGQAMALYRNVVLKDKAGKWTTQQRVNTDMLAEWLDYSMLEKHGNNTTVALDFEMQVEIQKAAMGIPISIYKMMEARAEDMFQSEYLTDEHGGKARFGWVADYFEAATNILSESRNDGIEVPQKMRPQDMNELIQHRLKKLVVSNMTRDIGGSSLSEMMLKLSEHGNFREDADGKKGAVITTSYVAYNHLNDLEGLGKILDCANEVELGQLFSYTALEAARLSKVTGLVGTEKEKFRKQYKSDPKAWLDLTPGAKIAGIKVEELFSFDANGKVMHGGLPKFLMSDADLGKELQDKIAKEQDPKKQAKLAKLTLPQYRDVKRREFTDFLNNAWNKMSPDDRTAKIVKRIITKRANFLHGLSDTVNGYPPPWRDELTEMIADGLMYRFGMYVNADDGLSGRSEEGKFNAAFRVQYNKNYGSGGNRYNLPYFLHTWLPEALVLKNREGQVFQAIMEEAARVRLIISRQARQEAERRFNTGELHRQFAAKKVKIDKVESMLGKTDAEKNQTARQEVINEEISKILTVGTGKARIAATAKFDSGELSQAYQAEVDRLRQSEPMRGKSEKEIKEAAKQAVITAEKERLLGQITDPKERERQDDALITAYNDIAQKMQFNAEVEKQAGTENYKNAFALSRELAFRTLDLTQAIKHGPEGPSVDLTKFMESFSKRATEIVKSIKEVDMAAMITAYDDKLKKVRKMTIAEHMLGAPVLAAMGLIKEDGSVDPNDIKKIMDEAKDKGLTNPFARWMMTALIAGEMQMVREYAYYNLSPRQGFALTETILQAMERVSGGKDADGNWVDFFSEDQMKFIRSESQTEKWRMYKNEILLSMLFGSKGKKDGLFSGMAEAFSIAFKYSFQGVANA